MIQVGWDLSGSIRPEDIPRFDNRARQEYGKSMSLRKKQEQVAELRRQLASAEEDLAAAQRIRAVEPEAGSMVYITARFPSSDTTYEYLAINTGSTSLPGGRVWYITGRAGKQTWDEILSRIERADYRVSRLFLD